MSYLKTKSSSLEEQSNDMMRITKHYLKKN